MIVTAALCWYDERPEDLAACVQGIATVADRIVAVDGAYARFPGGKAASSPEQAAAIRDVALACGMDALVIVPGRLWAGQVAKRSFLLAEAAKGSDWIAIVDTDWIATGDREAVRAELTRTRFDVVTVPFFTPATEAEGATAWHDRMAGTLTQQEHFFRALDGIRVERRHYWYSALKHKRRVWMWHGPTKSLPVLPKIALRARYTIEHRCFYRTTEQVLANRAYCNDRDMVLRLTGQEDDLPTLARPAFDFETVPFR